jgi:hypothetical protein
LHEPKVPSPLGDRLGDRDNLLLLQHHRHKHAAQAEVKLLEQRSKNWKQVDIEQKPTPQHYMKKPETGLFGKLFFL